MVLLEFRRINFFELKEGADDGKLAKLFNEEEIVLMTSGNNRLIVADSVGQIHLIPRSWNVITFRAFEIRTIQVQQLRNSPLLIAIGEDEKGINPLIKVWDTNRLDKNGTPHCTRITRAVIPNRAVEASTFCVHENQQLMAVGFKDGSLILYRGNVTRDRGFKQKDLKDSNSPVTGLAFKNMTQAILLYVATKSQIQFYNVTHKDKEILTRLDSEEGCSLNCSVLTESLQDSNFLVAKDNGIYCFTPDGRGPCFAIDGKKVMLQWFCNYLIIVSKIENVTPTQDQEGPSNTSPQHQINVLDIQNKFIVFSTTLHEVKAIVNEWGSFYIIDGNKNMLNLIVEKDLQSKLNLLFKKNMYDVAIRIAKSQQYDADSLVDIFRQYGDHLYVRGDHSGAIDQYIKTIGKLEPSYVILRFIDSKHIDKLTKYLQALHKQGQATGEHTTLLLNCFTKLNQTDYLKEFTLQQDQELNFDIDIAIKVCRQGNSNAALMLAKRHEKHDWYIKMQLEDHKRYADVIDYIASLNFENAELYMMKYGMVLVENAPEESTQFLKKLCTHYRPSGQDDILHTVDLNEKAPAENYISLFLHNSARLVEFLDHLLQEGVALAPPVCDTLLEHYLHVWMSIESNTGEKNKYSQKILNFMQNPETEYDKQQALVVCHMNGFSDGILYLYEEQKLYQQILRYHMSRKDVNHVIACCKRFEHQEPTLWVQALWSCVRDTENATKDLLPEVLNVIAKQNLLSPQEVVEAIGTGKAQISLSHIRSYIMNEFKKDRDVIVADQEVIATYRKDTDKLKKSLDILRNAPVINQGSRCAYCNHILDLPSIHFLCQHSYHQHCFQSYSDNENECLACQEENKKTLDSLKAREYKNNLNENFISLLDKADDPFSLTAEYFGRGVFNTVKVIVDKPAVKSEVVKEEASYGFGAEARIRQEENKRSAPALIPQSEGLIRMQENITTVKPVPTDPFADDCDDEYDESKDPFSDNYKEVNDYDKNLNPFTS